MFKSKILHSLLVAGFLASGGAANATVTTYDFGTLVSATNGYSAPNSFSSNPFAKLVVDDSYAAGTWRLSLTIQNNLFASFGADAYIQAMGFDYNPTPSPLPVSSFVSSNVGGVSTVWTGSGGATPPGFYQVDFRSVFGMNSPGRLQQNDNVTWDISGLGASTLTNMYIRTGFVTPGDNRWAKYVTVVPEPETYAMVLAGLGLLGFTARRRRNNA